MFLRGEYRYTGEYQLDFENTQSQEGYSIINARAGFTSQHVDVAEVAKGARLRSGLRDPEEVPRDLAVHVGGARIAQAGEAARLPLRDGAHDRGLAVRFGRHLLDARVDRVEADLVRDGEEAVVGDELALPDDGADVVLDGDADDELRWGLLRVLHGGLLGWS